MPVTTVAPRTTAITPTTTVATVPFVLSPFVLLGPTGTILGHAASVQDAANLADTIALASGEVVHVAQLGNTHAPKGFALPPKVPLTDEEKASVQAQRNAAEVAAAKVTAASALTALEPLRVDGALVVEDVHTGGGARPPQEPVATVGTERGSVGTAVVGSPTAIKPPNTKAGREDRMEILEGLSAAEVRTIAVSKGVEGGTKAENVKNILAAEFPK